MLQYDTVLENTLALDYWKLFQDLPEAYFLVEAVEPYRIVEINKAREKLGNVKRKDCIGRPLFEVFPDMTPKYRETGVSELRLRLEEIMRIGKHKEFEPFRYDIKDAEGVPRVHYWRTSYTPILDQEKAVRYILSAARDVTEEVKAARRAANMEDRLEAALAVGKVGSWLWDITENTITSDKNLAKLFHITKKRLAKGLQIEDFERAVHPEDRERVRLAIQRSITERVPFEEEYRITLPDGAQRWVLARGKVEEHDGRLFFPGVIVDITERRDLQAQVELAHRQDQLNRRAAKVLQRRNEELEAIGRSKDEFVALASHQLRTPATAVKQYLGMVLQGYAGEVPEIQLDMLDKAFESNERQIQIINQILNAARADTGRLVMSTVVVDLRILIKNVWSDMKPSFEQRGHRATINLPRTPVRVAADQGYLRMAVENVLNNACVYTPDGGQVDLKLQRAGSHCRLTISDTGVGIKKADFSKLFAKFSRIHNPLSVQAGGSGIGLYLTSEIVRLHAGKVTVESRLHKGTTFAISLPLAHN